MAFADITTEDAAVRAMRGLPGTGVITRDGDYFFVQLGPEWQAAADSLFAMVSKVFGVRGDVKTAGSRMVAGLPKGTTPSPDGLHFTAAVNPVGLHVTLPRSDKKVDRGRGGGASEAAASGGGASADGTYPVGQVVNFFVKRLYKFGGKASSYDATFHPAYWFAAEVQLLANDDGVAPPDVGFPPPHVTLAGYGIREGASGKKGRRKGRK